MDARERFLRVMNFEPCDRHLLWEFGYWAGALQRWHREGLPQTDPSVELAADGQAVAGEGLPWPHPTGFPRDSEVHAYLGLDAYLHRIPLHNILCPPFELRVLEEDEETRVVIDETGTTKRTRKDGTSMPHFLAYPVAGREDFERIKEERLQLSLKDRLPANWSELVAEYAHRDYPLGIGGGHGGYFGVLRELMGPERLFYMYYDDPGLIHQIQEHMTNLWIALYDRVLSDVKVDCALFWEDMAYRAGPLISEALFREFMMPYYRRLTGFFRDHGVRVQIVDTDGNCWKLIPLFLEAGLTGIYPFEVQAEMDVVEVRKQFPRLQILGGIDKRNLAQGREAIDQELDGKLPFMLSRGGYVAYVDHLVPPDVSWPDFLYYRQRVREMVEATPVRQAAVF